MLHAQVFVSSVAMTKKGFWFTDRERLAKENPEKYCFIKANAYVNAHNLKDGWIDDMKKEALSLNLFNAERMEPDFADREHRLSLALITKRNRRDDSMCFAGELLQNAFGIMGILGFADNLAVKFKSGIRGQHELFG